MSGIVLNHSRLGGEPAFRTSKRSCWNSNVERPAIAAIVSADVKNSRKRGLAKSQGVLTTSQVRKMSRVRISSASRNIATA